MEKKLSGAYLLFSLKGRHKVLKESLQWALSAACQSSKPNTNTNFSVFVLPLLSPAGGQGLSLKWTQL